MIDLAAHWNAVYMKKQPTEVSWFEDVPATCLALIDRAGIGPGHSMIDVGAGASRLVDALLDRGFSDVTVLDISQKALDVLRDRLGQRGARVTYVTADVTAFHPTRTWDVWHDRAVLHFLTNPTAQQAYARTVRAAINPGGHAVIAGFAPEGPTRCSDLDVVRHSTESIGLILGSGFALVESRIHEHVTPWGTPQAFQYTLWTRMK